MAYPKPKKTRQPLPGVRIDDTLIADLIHKHRGNISHVADAIGCARSTIQRRVNADAALQEAVKQERERWIDDLEDAVWSRAHETTDTALQVFLLKTQGRHRGYDASEAQNTAKDIATAAFDYILNKSKQQ